MNYLTDGFIIFSAELSHLSENENATRRFGLLAFLVSIRAEFWQVSGSYKGKKEESVLLPPQYMNVALGLARALQQESVLVKHSSHREEGPNQAYLVSPRGDGEIMAVLGKWIEITQRAASTLPAYTEIDGRYFTTKLQ